MKKKQKYYFISFLEEDGYGVFCVGMFRNAVIKVHPFVWMEKNNLALISYNEISEEDYKLGKDCYMTSEDNGRT